MSADFDNFVDILTKISKEQTGELDGDDASDSPANRAGANSPSDSDGPGFFKDAVNNVKKNTVGSAGTGDNSDNLTMFDLVARKKKTASRRKSTVTTRTTTTRTTTTRTTSSETARRRRRNDEPLCEKIFGSIVDSFLGTKKTTRKKTGGLLGSIVNGIFGSSGSAKSKSTRSRKTSQSETLTNSIVKAVFGTKSARKSYLNVFKKILKAIMKSGNKKALDTPAEFKKSALSLGFNNDEASEATSIFEGITSGGLSKNSVASLLQQFMDSDENTGDTPDKDTDGE